MPNIITFDLTESGISLKRGNKWIYEIILKTYHVLMRLATIETRTLESWEQSP